MGEVIKVGMADLNICKAPDTITTLGLGSCIGIALLDPVTKIGGLAHIMLPDSTKMKNNSNIAKFADTGIVELVRRMTEAGAAKSRLVAKIAGGARMFEVSGNSEVGSCIGIALLDPVTKIGGLAHIMLPDSTKMKNNSNIAKFADTGIVELVRRMTEAGAAKSRDYERVQLFAKRFKEELGSDTIICRELLGLSGPSDPDPAKRTKEYYQKRPCPETVAIASGLLGEFME